MIDFRNDRPSERNSRVLLDLRRTRRYRGSAIGDKDWGPKVFWTDDGEGTVYEAVRGDTLTHVILTGTFNEPSGKGTF